MEINENTIFLPKTQALIDAMGKQPTNEERITALENAVADLAIQSIGTEVVNND